MVGTKSSKGGRGHNLQDKRCARAKWPSRTEATGRRDGGTAWIDTSFDGCSDLPGEERGYRVRWVVQRGRIACCLVMSSVSRIIGW
jgi:hypothetical protein